MCVSVELGDGVIFFFQAEEGIRDLVWSRGFFYQEKEGIRILIRSRGLRGMYKRQLLRDS